MNLTGRERRLLILAGVFFSFLLLFLGMRGLHQKIYTLEKKKIQTEQTRSKLIEVYNAYEKLKSFKNAPAASEEELIPYMEQKLQAYQLKDNTKNMTPSKTSVGKKFVKFSVRLRLEKVPAEPVLRMLQEIEQDTSRAYRVDEFLSRKAYKTTGLYNIRFKISGFAKRN